MTNDPQMINSGYNRNRLDRYWTNPWMTNELFKHVRMYIPTAVWEPAAGRGDMSHALAMNSCEVYSSDIDMSEFDYPMVPQREISFFDAYEVPELEDGPCQAIITNPPYNIADKFIRHGLSFFDQGVRFMAMLMRSEFNSGKTRADLFGECPHYMGELVLTTRPRWDYGDPDAPETAAPRHNFSWFMWYYGWQDIYEYPIQLFSYMPKGFKP